MLFDLTEYLYYKCGFIHTTLGDLQQEQQQEQEEKEEKGDGSGGRHSSLGMSCSMFGVLDAFCQVDKILPLTDSAAPGAGTTSYSYETSLLSTV